jgi:hypothetical protein
MGGERQREGGEDVNFEFDEGNVYILDYEDYH